MRRYLNAAANPESHDGRRGADLASCDLTGVHAIRCGHRWGAIVAAMVFSGALCACAVAPPTGPLVMALPPVGKSLAVFGQDDAQCRNYASNAAASGYTLQQRYDIGYTQCMYSKGNSVQSPLPDYPNYAWLYPDLYGYPWFWDGPGFLSANVFVFHGSHFHHGHY